MTVEQDKSLKNYNTFGIDVSSKYFTEVNSIEDFRSIISELKFRDEKKFILGGGSNILFTKDFDGIVIKNSIRGISFQKEDAYYVWIKVAAGEVWHDFVRFCVDRNYAGVENLSLIPGLVGAAPMQNIGAYGVEMKETCEEVEAVDIETGAIEIFDNVACEFRYRDSVFKNKYKDRFLISSVTFRVNKIFKPKISYGDVRKTLEEMRAEDITIKTVSDAVIRIRSSKLPDPKVIGNAGSFFKNPSISKKQFSSLIEKYPLMPNYNQQNGTVKIAAGWLIEQCGWKGKVVGHTGAHKSQALVLVNYGGAIGDEVYDLALKIQKSVSEKFGIELLPEVNVI